MSGVITIPVFYCTKKRCVQKEKKEPNSTRLKFIKKWRMKGRGGVWLENGSFECSNCGHIYRKHIRSGRDSPK